MHHQMAAFTRTMYEPTKLKYFAIFGDCLQVRKNKFVEIVPINVGCLGACTYCKTKHARGHLGSYPVASLV